jgi:two-component system LytT family response regulator
MIRLLLVDDEKPARARLARLLSEIPDVQVVGEASNGLEALSVAQEMKPDVALLDIEMPELNGLEVAEAWVENGPAVIFVTAYTEHALRAFEVSALDYLVKPVSPDRLVEALEKARRHKNQPGLEQFQAFMEKFQEKRAKRRMAVKCGSRYRVLDPEKVTAVVAKDHYASILVEGQEILCDDSLDRLAQRLDPTRFLRIHRGAVINLDFLKELEHQGDRKYLAVLSDVAKTKLLVSRERLDVLKERLGLG